MAVYTLSGASNAYRWIAGELIATPRTADNGITVEEFQSLVNQCPHDDLTDEQAQQLFDTANYPACQEDVKSLHIHQQHGQDQGVIARTTDQTTEGEPSPWEKVSQVLAAAGAA
jgi:hypothetical protein